jgi:hypothetical protein
MMFYDDANPCVAVIPAKAGIHVALMRKAKMDSRFRGNDAQAKMAIAPTPRLLRFQSAA